MWNLLASLFKKSNASTEAGTVDNMSKLALFRSAAGALFTQTSLYAQLARVEWEIEKNRLLSMLIFFILGFSCFLCALLFTGVLIISPYWNTPYRTHSIVFVISIFLLITLFATIQLRKAVILGSDSFAATRREITADLALVKGML